MALPPGGSWFGRRDESSYWGTSIFEGPGAGASGQRLYAGLSRGLRRGPVQKRTTAYSPIAVSYARSPAEHPYVPPRLLPGEQRGKGALKWLHQLLQFKNGGRVQI